ncbi:hypothetical protein PIB30_070793 [Stylosanthes scabra]|uniref:RNase H type-1 domain-containing protein n=1 Tax=Stylosanthes scabra TaxID=79078 RepID=A0ABU6WM05_9FABA|nr:hypothetical protein [Stylosanthes scabra]
MWNFGEDGIFSIRSFVMTATDKELGLPAVKHVFDNIWKGLVPPRTEILWGYFTNERGVIECWMGEVVTGSSYEEAYIKGLEVTIKFLIEEVNVCNDNIVLVSDRKHIVEWVNGKEETSWEMRFLKNRIRNMGKVFTGVHVLFKHGKEFKARATWEELAKHASDRWIHWRNH